MQNILGEPHCKSSYHFHFEGKALLFPGLTQLPLRRHGGRNWWYFSCPVSNPAIKWTFLRLFINTGFKQTVLMLMPSLALQMWTSARLGCTGVERGSCATTCPGAIAVTAGWAISTTPSAAAASVRGAGRAGSSPCLSLGPEAVLSITAV